MQGGVHLDDSFKFIQIFGDYALFLSLPDFKNFFLAYPLHEERFDKSKISSPYLLLIG